MYLNRIAERFGGETFEAFDESTLSFTPHTLSGRVAVVDRFQSIYNKPLRRRSLYSEPGQPFPESHTVRLQSTGEVYLLGQRRQDSDHQLGEYREVTVLHLVTDEDDNASSGLAKVHRKLPQGPAEDPGWLVDEVVAHHYADLEFRTSGGEQDTYELKVLNFYAHFPRHAELHQHDYVELHGRFYRVIDQYADSGFMAARMDREDDTRVDFVLHVKQGKTYDETLMRYVSTNQSYNVTGEVVTQYDIGEWSSESQSYMDVVVDRNHVGFEPEAGMEIEFDGRRRVIRRVSTQAGEKQYRLRCY